MSRLLSLAHLTVIDLDPPAMIRAAAAAGFDAVGLRLIRVTPDSPGYPLMDDPAALRATRAALDDTGLRVLDIEFVRIDPAFDPLALDGFLAAGAALGARHVICAPYDADLARLSDRLGAFAGRCRAHGLTPVLEFFPWTPVPDLATAIAVVEASGAADAGVLVDALHFDRSGSRLADLARIAAQRVPFVHLCDAPRHPPYTNEQLLHAGRAERLLPGEGAIDLAALLSAVPRDVPLALEIPQTARRQAIGSAALARETAAAARHWLATNLPG